MPSHDHQLVGGGGLAQFASSYALSNGSFSNPVHYGEGSFAFSTGGNQPHENMPPYIAAFCWKRLE